MRAAIQRELRVAFSRRAQPIWFRMTKWSALAILAIVFWRSRVFWCFIACLFVFGLTIHFMYRRKTDRWTKPWGGWDDVEAGR